MRAERGECKNFLAFADDKESLISETCVDAIAGVTARVAIGPGANEGGIPENRLQCEIVIDDDFGMRVARRGFVTESIR
jgi:hypothetical protein